MNITVNAVNWITSVVDSYNGSDDSSDYDYDDDDDDDDIDSDEEKYSHLYHDRFQYKDSKKSKGEYIWHLYTCTWYKV